MAWIGQRGCSGECRGASVVLEAGQYCRYLLVIRGCYMTSGSFMIWGQYWLCRLLSFDAGNYDSWNELCLWSGSVMIWGQYWL